MNAVPRYCLGVLGNTVFLLNPRLVLHEHMCLVLIRLKKYVLLSKHIRSLNYFKLLPALSV